MCSEYQYGTADQAYVCEDGNYGGGAAIIYNPSNLADYQLELMVEMHDNDRFDYIKAILDADLVAVERFEANYV